MPREQTARKMPPPPYSLRVQDMKDHFGIAPQTVYQWINQGRLLRGKHYLKVGNRVFIVREAFVEFMREEDGFNGGR